MSQRNEPSLPNLEAWRVGALRLTAFTDPLTLPGAHPDGKRWEALVGQPPENVSSRMFGAEHEEIGSFPAGGKLSYKRSHRGAEWFLEPVQEPQRPETGLWMSMAVLRPFQELMRRWLIDCPSLRRLAFGAALYLPVKEKTEGYHLLSTYLRLPLDLTNLGDFICQVNRRRNSGCGVPNLQVNRLSKWTWLQVGFRVGAHEPLWPANSSACLLELDINTATDYREPLSGETYVPLREPLPATSYVPLFDELVSFAEEIAREGDVP